MMTSTAAFLQKHKTLYLRHVVYPVWFLKKGNEGTSISDIIKEVKYM